MPRRVPIFQFPNPPLLATMAAAAIARMTRLVPPDRLDEGVLRARDQDMPGVCLASRARPIALQPEHRKATEQR